jgi:hypothetical protein
MQSRSRPATRKREISAISQQRTQRAGLRKPPPILVLPRGTSMLLPRQSQRPSLRPPLWRLLLPLLRPAPASPLPTPVVGSTPWSAVGCLEAFGWRWAVRRPRELRRCSRAEGRVTALGRTVACSADLLPSFQGRLALGYGKRGE